MFALTHVGNFDGAMEPHDRSGIADPLRAGWARPCHLRDRGSARPNTITPFPVAAAHSAGRSLPASPSAPRRRCRTATGHSAATTAYARDVRPSAEDTRPACPRAAPRPRRSAPSARPRGARRRRSCGATTLPSRVLARAAALEPALLAPGGARRARRRGAAAVRAPPHARGAPGRRGRSRGSGRRGRTRAAPRPTAARRRAGAGGVRAGRRAARRDRCGRGADTAARGGWGSAGRDGAASGAGRAAGASSAQGLGCGGRAGVGVWSGGWRGGGGWSGGCGWRRRRSQTWRCSFYEVQLTPRGRARAARRLRQRPPVAAAPGPHLSRPAAGSAAAGARGSERWVRARRFSYTDFRLGREEWGAAGRARHARPPRTRRVARPGAPAQPGLAPHRPPPRPVRLSQARFFVRGSLCAARGRWAALCNRLVSLGAIRGLRGARGAQDDVAPLLVLTKDILRKFHLGEVAPALHAPPPVQIGRTSLPLPLPVQIGRTSLPSAEQIGRTSRARRAGPAGAERARGAGQMTYQSARERALLGKVAEMEAWEAENRAKVPPLPPLQ